MLEADCSVVAESCTLLTELRLTTETLLSVDDVRPIAELLTNCRFATELFVVLLELTTTLLSRPTSDTEFCVTATKLTIGAICSISTTISETLGEVLETRVREALPCTCTEEVAFCAEGVSEAEFLLTSCKFGTLLAVVVATAVLTLEVTPILEVEAAVELTSCMTALPLKGIDETAGDVLVETVVLLLELTATVAVELAVVAEILQVEVFGVPVTDIEDTLAAVLEDTETVILLATDTEDVELCVEAAIETSEEVSCSPKNQDVAMG